MELNFYVLNRDLLRVKKRHPTVDQPHSNKEPPENPHSFAQTLKALVFAAMEDENFLYEFFFPHEMNSSVYSLLNGI